MELGTQYYADLSFVNDGGTQMSSSAWFIQYKLEHCDRKLGSAGNLQEQRKQNESHLQKNQFYNDNSIIGLSQNSLIIHNYWYSGSAI